MISLKMLLFLFFLHLTKYSQRNANMSMIIHFSALHLFVFCFMYLHY